MSDEDIPDLIPGAPGTPPAAPRPAAPRRAASGGSASPRVPKASAESRTPAPSPAKARPTPPPPRPPSEPPASSPLPSARGGGLSLDLDLDYGEPEVSNAGRTQIGGTPDDLEFDPISSRDPSGAAAFSRSAPAPVAKKKAAPMELDFSAPEPQAKPAPRAPQASASSQAATAQRRALASSTIAGGPGAALGDDHDIFSDDPGTSGGIELEMTSQPGLGGPASQPQAAPSRSASPRQSSPPASPRQSSPPGSLRPSSAPGSWARGASPDVPSLNPAKVPSVRAPAASPARGVSSPSAPPPSQDLSHFPGMGGEVDLGDDLDFGGAGSAQLNVAVPMAQEDEVPWPTGKTPEVDEIDVDEEEAAEISGFGPPPLGIFNAPMYFIRVRLALGELNDKVRLAKQGVVALERSRDERLGRMAEEKRAELAGKERFSSLYSNIDKFDAKIVEKRGVLKVADIEGADELRDITAKMDTLSVERREKEKVRDLKKATFDQCELQIHRARAIQRKVGIARRNLDEQKQAGYDFGVVSYEIRLEAQEREELAAEQEAKQCLADRGRFARELEETEDEVRRVVADTQALEAQKEGLLMTLEGEIAEHSRSLDDVVLRRETGLADAARVILDLRGDVPVDAQFRREMLEVDANVREAFAEYQTALAALGSMDERTFQLGKSVWVGLGVLFVLVLLIGAIF